MIEELYVVLGIATLVYFLINKTKREAEIEITPLQPVTPLSPMSVCSDLMVVSPLRFEDDYMDLVQTKQA